MSVIIDTTKSELEAVIRYARIGANNCMIANSWELTDLVRCKDCCYWDRETVRQNSNDVSWWNEAVCRKHSVDGNEPHEMWTDADWFCKDGERRSE